MTAVVDSRTPLAALQSLRELGHEILTLPPHPSLPEPVASHPDMLLFFATDCIFCTAEWLEVAFREAERISEIVKKPLRVITGKVKNHYPHDILLNAAPIGARLFCNAAYTARELVTHPDYQLCSVRQGYAKCSVLPLGEDALITADPSIARKADENGIDVLQIQQGFVSLPGYSYGFLGGATSFSPYSKSNTVLFCGNPDLHPNAERIKDFCRLHGYQTHSLGEFPLTDVGTLFLI